MGFLTAGISEFEPAEPSGLVRPVTLGSGLNYGPAPAPSPSDRPLTLGSGLSYSPAPSAPGSSDSLLDRAIRDEYEVPDGGGGKNLLRGVGSSIVASRQSNFDTIMDSLEAQRQQMIDRRDAAIRAAGRGAGAPYAAAIARLDQQIGDLKKAQPVVGDLFNRKIQQEGMIWDAAAGALTGSSDEFVSNSQDITDRTRVAVETEYDVAERRASDLFNKIGATMTPDLVDEIHGLESEVLNMEEVSGESTRRLMKSAEDVAVKMAVATGATNALDLKRKQIMVETDLQTRMRDLLRERDAQVKARNAAISAAKELEAARWPEGQPLNRSGFQVVAANRFFDARKVPEVAQDLAEFFVNSGMSASEVRELQRNVTNGIPNQTASAIMARYGINPDQWSALPSNAVANLSEIATGIEAYERAGTDYDSNFVGADPRDFPEGSAARAMAAQQWFLSQGHSEEDSFYFGREAADTSNEDLSWIGGY